MEEEEKAFIYMSPLASVHSTTQFDPRLGIMVGLMHPPIQTHRLYIMLMHYIHYTVKSVKNEILCELEKQK